MQGSDRGGRGGKCKDKVSQTGTPHASLYNRCAGRIRRSHAESIALNMVDFAVADSWAPRPWKPARTRSNYHGVVTKW